MQCEHRRGGVTFTANQDTVAKLGRQSKPRRDVLCHRPRKLKTQANEAGEQRKMGAQ